MIFYLLFHVVHANHIYFSQEQRNNPVLNTGTAVTGVSNALPMWDKVRPSNCAAQI